LPAFDDFLETVCFLTAKLHNNAKRKHFVANKKAEEIGSVLQPFFVNNLNKKFLFDF
jgi:hypothetical protein